MSSVPPFRFETVFRVAPLDNHASSPLHASCMEKYAYNPPRSPSISSSLGSSRLCSTLLLYRPRCGRVFQYLLQKRRACGQPFALRTPSIPSYPSWHSLLVIPLLQLITRVVLRAEWQASLLNVETPCIGLGKLLASGFLLPSGPIQLRPCKNADLGLKGPRLTHFRSQLAVFISQ